MASKSGNRLNWNRRSTNWARRRASGREFEPLCGARYHRGYNGGGGGEHVPEKLEQICEAQDYLDDLQTLNRRTPSLPKLKFMGDK